VTETMQGNKHCRPEALYFWVYYICCNIPWLVVPVILAWRSFRAMTDAMVATEGGAARKFK